VRASKGLRPVCLAWPRRCDDEDFASSGFLVAERAVEALADAVQVVEDLHETSAECVDALGDRPDLPLELALVAVQRRALHVDHASEPTHEIDERIESAGRARETFARIDERRGDLGDARLEAANALGQEIARLG
jgi:hypothetical protein